MNIVISFQKIGSGSYEMASLKIAKFLAGEFSAEIIDCPEKAVDFIYSAIIPEKVFIVSGMWQFCKFRDHAETICSSASKNGAKMFFCCNDYKTPFPGSLKKAIPGPVIFLGNGNYGPGYKLVNWNALTFYKKPVISHGGTNSMVYYGAYREGRGESFDRFFKGRKFKTFISTSEKNFPEFQKHGNVAFEPSKDLSVIAKKYSFTVYISDKVNHQKMFVFPANRFYECLSEGIFQFIDQKTLLSFSKGFSLKSLEPFLVNDHEDIASKIAQIDFLWMAQKKLLVDGKNYSAELKNMVHEVVNG